MKMIVLLANWKLQQQMGRIVTNIEAINNWVGATVGDGEEAEVIDIFSKSKREPAKPTDFEIIEAENKAKAERSAKERLNRNKSTLQQYKIYPKGKKK